MSVPTVRNTCLAGLVLAAIPWGDAAGATFLVDDTADIPDALIDGVCAADGGTCTLRAAVMEANATEEGDEIVLEEYRTYRIEIEGEGGAEVGDLDVTAPLVILGNDADVEGWLHDRLFHFQLDGGEAVEVYQLGLHWGMGQWVGGAVLIEGDGTGQVWMGNVSLKSNQVEYDPDDAYHAEHHLGPRGGAIAVEAGHLEMDTCKVQGDYFINIHNLVGGGVYVAPGAALSVNDTLFTRLSIGGDVYTWSFGGALAILGAAEIERSRFVENGAHDGGALAVLGDRAPGGVVRITNCSFADNDSEYGGALLAHAARVVVTGTTLAFNSARWGSAIYSEDSVVTLNHVTMARNGCALAPGKARAPLVVYGGEFFPFTLKNTILANFQPVDEDDVREDRFDRGSAYCSYDSGRPNYYLGTSTLDCEGHLTLEGANIIRSIGYAAGPVCFPSGDLSRVGTAEEPYEALLEETPMSHWEPAWHNALVWGFDDIWFAPLPGSPAIDAGGEVLSVHDQTGGAFDVDGDGDGVRAPDLGAVEYRGG